MAMFQSVLECGNTGSDSETCWARRLTGFFIGVAEQVLLFPRGSMVAGPRVRGNGVAMVRTSDARVSEWMSM